MLDANPQYSKYKEPMKYCNTCSQVNVSTVTRTDESDNTICILYMINVKVKVDRGGEELFLTQGS